MKYRRLLFVCLIAISTILIALVILKLVQNQKAGVDSIKYIKFVNHDVGYQIKYPENWYVKTKYRPSKEDTLSFEYILFDNTEEAVIVAGGGPLTEKGTTFVIKIWKSSIGGKNAKDIEESIKQGHFSGNPEIQAKLVNQRLKEVKVTSIGGKKLKVWHGHSGGALDFIYKNKYYRLLFMSGSREQHLKDLPVYEKMLESFKLLD